MLFLSAVILVKPLQPLNAFSPISVTLLGMVMLFKPLQPLNAYPPISVTLLGMVMLFKPVQPLNAHQPIPVTLYLSIVLGMVTALLPMSLYFVIPAVPSSNTEYSNLPLVTALATKGTALNMPATIITDSNSEVILFNFVISFSS